MTTSDYQKKWREENKEHWQEYIKNYYFLHKVAMNEHSKKQYKKLVEEGGEPLKRRRKQICEATKRYREKHNQVVV